MLRAVIFAALATGAFVACSDDAERHINDAPVDSKPDAPPADTGSGSGSDEMATLDTPHDRNLEMVVVASSLLVAVGPLVGSAIGARRRRITTEL